MQIELASQLTRSHSMRRNFLPLAAERSDENLEYVHLLRVWSRRSLAVLNLYKRVLPKKKWRCLRKKLQKIRDVAGDARDLDVLLSQIVDEGTWESKTFEIGVRRRRAKAQRPIQRCCDRMRRRSRLVKLFMKLLSLRICRSHLGPSTIMQSQYSNSANGSQHVTTESIGRN